MRDRNYGRGRVTLDKVVRAPAFRQGFADYVKGAEPLFDSPERIKGRRGTPSNRIWSYERGRLFAAYCRGEGIQLDPRQWFVDRRLSWAVLDAAADALRARALT